jgi:hypothetical protein
VRLIGSLTEEDLRRRLSASNAALCAGAANPTLQRALLTSGVDPATAYVLDCVPEQAEDFYTVLDGTRQMLTIELPRGRSGPAEIKAIPFTDFRTSIASVSRRARLQFAVAMALLREASGDSSRGVVSDKPP